MVLHEGDLMERKRITKGELAILRLVAGQTVLKLATEKIYEHLIDHVSFTDICIVWIELLVSTFGIRRV